MRINRIIYEFFSLKQGGPPDKPPMAARIAQTLRRRGRTVASVWFADCLREQQAPPDNDVAAVGASVDAWID